MDPSPTATSRVTIRYEEANGMEVSKKTSKPKFADLKGSAMTLSGEEDGMATEATQILMDYAVTKGHTLNSVTHMSRPQLADFLRDFYLKMKQKSDDSPPMKGLRSGLHKFFLEEVNIDILHDRTFEAANTTFEQGLRANPRKCHKVRIDMEDLKKIYLGDAMDTNKPDTLQNKVFFDISLYICNKGKDYLRNMKKTDFDVTTDIHGRRYVWLKDPSAAPRSVPREEEYPLKLKLKRAAEDNNPAYQIGERMYERPGDPRCPLASFLKYVTHLHPMTDAFWQRPKRSVSQSDYVWYDHAALGSSTLTKIMQRISQQAGVSDSYTNYSIRSSCIPLVEAVCEQALLAENEGHPVSNKTYPAVSINRGGGVKRISPTGEVRCLLPSASLWEIFGQD
ncbi:BTB/POZ domain-containing protein kctd1 [Plakobranchus ocellatus]|uniref:BTB/POZ domain-containing protein kctd1 n=1 Tax=Plakobranchus ocellatus TaxID=259542 RepID=A0AAV4AHA5_9GAST|nr:BTB/POZ domain-containing protein kctd1 [Plakobranchus ocellatus]